MLVGRRLHVPSRGREGAGRSRGTRACHSGTCSEAGDAAAQPCGCSARGGWEQLARRAPPERTWDLQAAPGTRCSVPRALGQVSLLGGDRRGSGPGRGAGAGSLSRGECRSRASTMGLWLGWRPQARRPACPEPPMALIWAGPGPSGGLRDSRARGPGEQGREARGTGGRAVHRAGDPGGSVPVTLRAWPPPRSGTVHGLKLPARVAARVQGSQIS